jgi:hypothetical protein
MDYFPYITVFNIKNSKNMAEFSMILRYLIDIMENKGKFRPDPGIKLIIGAVRSKMV